MNHLLWRLFHHRRIAEAKVLAVKGSHWRGDSGIRYECVHACPKGVFLLPDDPNPLVAIMFIATVGVDHLPYWALARRFDHVSPGDLLEQQMREGVEV